MARAQKEIEAHAQSIEKSHVGRARAMKCQNSVSRAANMLT